MKIDIQNQEESNKYFTALRTQIEKNPLCATKYIDLGAKTIRVLCYTPEILPHMQKQLTYTLRDTAERYDDTLIVWKETDPIKLAVTLDDKFNPMKNLRLRLEYIAAGKKMPNLFVFDKNFSSTVPVMFFNDYSKTIEAIDAQNHTYYYGVSNFEPEEFIKEGHLFVQLINRVLQTPTANLAHGAVLGYAGNGVLFCARGQRGKSTLTVLSMMKGFEYVSDDYLILETKNGKLYSSPIYSIITLSPRMYNELYDELKGKFVCNNARKDKYVINIADYHHQFRTDYPIRLCIFPEIVSDKDPSLYECSAEDKGRAITQLIQSTVSQMRDCNNKPVIKKMLEMVKDMPFYKLNLCNDIQRNTIYLREFLEKWQPEAAKQVELEKVLCDITFDIANLIDTQTYTIYTMNKFATNIYENLLNGAAKEDIEKELKKLGIYPEHFDLFIETLQTKGFLKNAARGAEVKINPEFAKENNGKLSITEFAEDTTIELIK